MAIGALALMPLTAVATEEAAARGIFTPVGTMEEHRSRAEHPVSPGRLLEAEAGRSESRHGDRLRSRPVVVDLVELATVRGALGGALEKGRAARVRLNLFPDVDLSAEIARTAESRYGYSLSGSIGGDAHGSVTLVVHGDILAGAVHSRAGTFVIAAHGGAVHTVREISGDFLCGVDGRSHDIALSYKSQNTGTSVTSDDNGSEVDLLVLFTQAALDVEGSLQRMRSSIDLALAWANDVYEAGGIDFRVRLVGTVLVA